MQLFIAFSIGLVLRIDNPDIVKKKANSIKESILEKYKDLKSLLEALNKVVNVSNVKYLCGNHDNFLGNAGAKPLKVDLSRIKIYKEFMLGKNFTPNNERFEISFQSNNSIFIIPHGHNWDKFNSDDDFEIGYLITRLVMMFEAKGN